MVWRQYRSMEDAEHCVAVSSYRFDNEMSLCADSHSEAVLIGHALSELDQPFTGYQLDTQAILFYVPQPLQ